MSDGVTAGAVVDYARGILAERFGIGIATAGRILQNVAHAESRDVAELAAAVVESCTVASTELPRSLYMNGSGTS